MIIFKYTICVGVVTGLPVSVKKTLLQKNIDIELLLAFSEHQIRSWRAVSAEELQGEGSHKRTSSVRQVVESRCHF